MGKRARNSKLMWLGGVTVALGAVQTGMAGLGHAVSPEVAGIINMVIGVLIAVFRFATDQAIARDNEDQE